jgi:Type IV secretory system Conjugative DNA transfer
VPTDHGLDQLHHYLSARGGGLYVGAGSGQLAFAAPQQAVLVLGPPRSGKTSAVVVPNVLAAPGAVLSTSTKVDVLTATLPRRARQGRCWLLDPTGTVAVPDGVTPIRWSPVEACRGWDESLVTVRAMVGAARPGGRNPESSHWTERAEALLAPLLHAAALGGGDMETVVRWVLRQDLDAPGQELARSGAASGLAADVLAGLAATDPRELSGIWSTAAGVLSAYRSEAALATAREVNFDPRAFAASADTVYVCAPARHQALVAPIVVAFVEQLRAGAYALSAAGRPFQPMVLALDELANVAPLPDLPSLVSEGGGQGVLTLGCLQDLSQARQRWGPAADGFLSLFGPRRHRRPVDPGAGVAPGGGSRHPGPLGQPTRPAGIRPLDLHHLVHPPATTATGGHRQPAAGRNRTHPGRQPAPRSHLPPAVVDGPPIRPRATSPRAAPPGESTAVDCPSSPTPDAPPPALARPGALRPPPRPRRRPRATPQPGAPAAGADHDRASSVSSIERVELLPRVSFALRPSIHAFVRTKRPRMPRSSGDLPVKPVRDAHDQDDHVGQAEQTTEPICPVHQLLIGPDHHGQIHSRLQVRMTRPSDETASITRRLTDDQRQIWELHDRKAPRIPKRRVSGGGS